MRNLVMMRTKGLHGPKVHNNIKSAGNYIGPYMPGSAGRFGAEFDGSASFMTRGGDLTNNADGRFGILSVWAYLTDAAVTMRMIDTANSRFAIQHSATHEIIISGVSPSAVGVLTLQTTNIAPHFQYVHLLASWNMTTGAAKFYMNDVDETNLVLMTTGNDIDYTDTEHYFGRSAFPIFHLDGAISEFYLNTAEYIDLSIEANRRKFISAQGKPVFMGANGSAPTGNQPIIYFNKRYNEFQINNGYGGDYGVTGSLEDAEGALYD